ncbi:hypothetical protein BGX38DRAFT_1161763 [Terfezia claveryi]|nr:hypothetical protein BGX38DRAFT_1161763 [Terfezia claveryi]
MHRISQAGSGWQYDSTRLSPLLAQALKPETFSCDTGCRFPARDAQLLSFHTVI